MVIIGLRTIFAALRSLTRVHSSTPQPVRLTPWQLLMTPEVHLRATPQDVARLCELVRMMNLAQATAAVSLLPDPPDWRGDGSEAAPAP